MRRHACGVRVVVEGLDAGLARIGLVGPRAGAPDPADTGTDRGPAPTADRGAQPGAQDRPDRGGAELRGGCPVHHRLDLRVHVEGALALVRLERSERLAGRRQHLHGGTDRLGARREREQRERGRRTAAMPHGWCSVGACGRGARPRS